MATKTKKLTMPEDTLQRLKTSATIARARSLSSYVSELVEKHEDEITYSEYLDNFKPTPEQQAWANKVLGMKSTSGNLVFLLRGAR